MDFVDLNDICENRDPWTFPNDWRWCVSDRHFHLEQISAQSYTIANSSAQPFKFIDNSSMAAVFLIGSPTSSSIQVVLPERPWSVDYFDQQAIAFSEKISSYNELTSVRASWDRELVFTQTEPKRFQGVFERVGHFSKLKANWDHYGAKPIDDTSVDQALSILNRLLGWKEESRMPVPFVAPLPTGGIQFEWEKETRFLELSIAPDSRTLGFFATDSIDDGDISIEGLIRSEEELIQLLSWFVKGTIEDVVHLRVVGGR